MVIDDWLFAKVEGIHDSVTAEAIQLINSWVAPQPATQPWLSREDLPDEVLSAFKYLYEAEQIRQWCYETKEWKSLETDWKALVLLPFASTRARIAAVYLRHLLEERYVRRSPARTVWLGINPSTDRDQRKLFGGYAVALWKVWHRRWSESLLNVTACPKELVGASVLIASLDCVPLTLWSEQLQELVWLPGWEFPRLEPDEERLLRELVNGIPLNEAQGLKFLSKWLPITGAQASTASAVILKERFDWVDEQQTQPDEISLWGRQDHV
jgi:hypothetical protein